MSELHTQHPIITLTTDFGMQDWYVGVMKGVIASMLPAAQVIDITHAIPPGNVRQGAFVLKQALPWFPIGSIHVGVVDPGVGTDRKAIVLETEKGYCVGPDNGLFSWAVEDHEIKGVYEISPKKLGGTISHTFHGRDLFAPMAALLALGAAESKLDRSCKEILRFDWPKWEMHQDTIQGEILHVDRFGNLITNLPLTHFATNTGTFNFQLRENNTLRSVDIHTTYGNATEGELALIAGSTGYLEWAIKNGSAAKELGWQAGKTFLLTKAPSP